MVKPEFIQGNKLYIQYKYCGSVVEHCVSSAKVVDSQEKISH